MVDGPWMLSPLTRLLAAYSAHPVRASLIWAYDARLADIVRTTREPVVGQMRLTWWHEVLSDETGVKGRGDPLVDAMRAHAEVMAGRAALLRMIDGWEMLLDPLPLDLQGLRTFAEGRGGGLFAALDGDSSAQAGALWALWDMSGRVGDAETAQGAVELAQTYLSAPAPGDKGVRIAATLARGDIRRGRAGPARMTPAVYGRVVRASLFGR